MEIIKPITEYNLKPYYSISDSGNIYTIYKKDEKMKTRLDKDGYETITLLTHENKKPNLMVHRLLLVTFCPIQDYKDLQVNHKDGNKLNNKLDNLEWVTCLENIQHARIHKLNINSGENHKNASLTEEQVLEILRLYKYEKISYSKLAERFNIGKSGIAAIIKNRTWKYINREDI